MRALGNDVSIKRWRRRFGNELWPSASRRQRLIGWRRSAAGLAVLSISRLVDDCAVCSILQRLIGHQAPTDKHRARAGRGQPLWADRSACLLPAGHALDTVIVRVRRIGRSDWLAKRDVDCSLHGGLMHGLHYLAAAGFAWRYPRCDRPTGRPTQPVVWPPITPSATHTPRPDTPLWALSETILERFRCPVIFITVSPSELIRAQYTTVRHHKDAFCPYIYALLRSGGICSIQMSFSSIDRAYLAILPCVVSTLLTVNYFICLSNSPLPRCQCSSSFTQALKLITSVKSLHLNITQFFT